MNSEYQTPPSRYGQRLFVFYLFNGLVWVCRIDLSHMAKNNGNPDQEEKAWYLTLTVFLLIMFCVIVVLPDHTHFRFSLVLIAKTNIIGSDVNAHWHSLANLPLTLSNRTKKKGYRWTTFSVDCHNNHTYSGTNHNNWYTYYSLNLNDVVSPRGTTFLLSDITVITSTDHNH